MLMMAVTLSVLGQKGEVGTVAPTVCECTGSGRKYSHSWDKVYAMSLHEGTGAGSVEFSERSQYNTCLPCMGLRVPSTVLLKIYKNKAKSTVCEVGSQPEQREHLNLSILLLGSQGSEECPAAGPALSYGNSL